MNEQQLQDLSAGLRRSSRASAVGIAVGAMLVLGAIGYSFWSLHNVEAAVEAKQKDIADLQQKIVDKHAELDDLQKQLDTMHGKVETAQTLVNHLWQKNPWPEDPKLQAELIKVNLKPKVTAKPADKVGDRQYYTFTLQMMLPPNEDLAKGMEKAIQKVSYRLASTNYSLPNNASSDPKTGYAYSYRGWGTLGVIATVTLKDGREIPIEFDMQTVLGYEHVPAGHVTQQKLPRAK
jgi:cell division protein FtsB